MVKVLREVVMVLREAVMVLKGDGKCPQGGGEGCQFLRKTVEVFSENLKVSGFSWRR